MVRTILDAEYQSEKRTIRKIIVTWFLSATLAYAVTLRFGYLDIVPGYFLCLIVTGGIPFLFFWMKMTSKT